MKNNGRPPKNNNDGTNQEKNLACSIKENVFLLWQERAYCSIL